MKIDINLLKEFTLELRPVMKAVFHPTEKREYSYQGSLEFADQVSKTCFKETLFLMKMKVRFLKQAYPRA